MTATVTFDQSSIFGGFSITYKLNDDMSKTLLVAEAYRRLSMCLESLNFDSLQKILQSHSFVIHSSIENLKDGDQVFIACVLK